MTTRETMLHVVEDLPADATIEDATERLLFLAKVERGLKQANSGETIPHNEMKKRMAQ